MTRTINYSRNFHFIALTFLLSTLAMTAPANTPDTQARQELPEGSEAAKAVARLGELTRPALRERLRQLRPPDNLFSPFLQNKLIEIQNLHVANNKQVDRLKAALTPVLEFHERRKMPICVLRSEQPMAYLVDRAVIFITTRMMEIASEEELRGIAAHELAHEYVWEDYKKARLAKNQSVMRECELFCDAVAAFTLKEIGDAPASYRRILVRLAIIGINVGNGIRRETDTHPALEIREKLNKFLCERLI